MCGLPLKNIGLLKQVLEKLIFLILSLQELPLNASVLYFQHGLLCPQSCEPRVKVSMENQIEKSDRSATQFDGAERSKRRGIIEGTWREDLLT